MTTVISSDASYPQLIQWKTTDDTIVKFDLKTKIILENSRTYTFKKNRNGCHLSKYGYIYGHVPWTLPLGRFQTMIGVYDCGKTNFNVGNSPVDNLWIVFNYGFMRDQIGFHTIRKVIMENVNLDNVFSDEEMKNIKIFVGHQENKWRWTESDLEMTIKMNRNHPDRIHFVKEDGYWLDRYYRDDFSYKTFNKLYDLLEKTFHLKKLDAEN